MPLTDRTGVRPGRLDPQLTAPSDETNVAALSRERSSAGPALYFWRTDAGEVWIKEKPVPRSWVRRSWRGVKEGTGDIDYPDLR